MSFSISSSQNGYTTQKSISPFLTTSQQHHDTVSKDSTTSEKQTQQIGGLFSKMDQSITGSVTAAQLRLNESKSVQFQDNDSNHHSNQESRLKAISIQRDQLHNKPKQSSQNEINDTNKKSQTNLNIKQNENKFDDKSNLEYKRLLDILSEDNSIKAKKINQLKNYHQNGSYISYDKEKDSQQDGFKFKSFKSAVNGNGEKTEDLIYKTILSKKSELDIMENQIQEQSMYNQTLNFMQLRTDISLKEQKKLVLKMEKLNKIVTKKYTQYRAILQEHNSQQQLVEFKMAEQIAQIINKEEIYKSIDQNRIKLKQTQNEDFNKLVQEQEQIIKQITILKQTVQDQEKLISDLNQVSTNVDKLKMSFPYTFQNAESMLFVVNVLCHPKIEQIFNDIFYSGIKQNSDAARQFIQDSANKILNSSSLNSNSNVNFASQQSDLINEQDKNKSRYDYKHQISNSFNQAAILMKDNKIFLKILDALQENHKEGQDKKTKSSQSIPSRTDKSRFKKGKPSIFVRKKSAQNLILDGVNGQQNLEPKKSIPSKKIIVQPTQQTNFIGKINENTLGTKKYHLIIRVKDKFLNSLQKYNPNMPDFRYRFILRDLTSLDSKSNRYMSTLEKRIKEFEKNNNNVTIDEYISSIYQQMMNKFIEMRSLVSLKIQEKNLKFEKNKKLNKRILELKQKILKKYEINDNLIFDNSKYFTNTNKRNNQTQEIEQGEEDEQIYNYNDQITINSSPQNLSKKEQRNIRLMIISENHSRNNSVTPSKQLSKQLFLLSQYQIKNINFFFQKDNLDSEQPSQMTVERSKQFSHFDDNDGDDQYEDINLIYKNFSTDFQSLNSLNNQLDILKYQNLHQFSESGASNSHNLPLESSFMILQKTLGVVKRIQQLVNTCLTATYEHYYDDVDNYKDLGKAYTQFNLFNKKMKSFFSKQEGRFFESIMLNQQVQSTKKKHLGGIGSLLKQFQSIFNNNLPNAEMLYQSLIAHDVVVINFLDSDDIENELKQIKSKFDDMCYIFITKYKENQELDCISNLDVSNSDMKRTLLDIMQPEQTHEQEEKMKKMVEKCLEFQLMNMISDQSLHIIYKAHNQCQETTKNIFSLCYELYIIIFSILIKRKKIIEEQRTIHRDTSPHPLNQNNEQKSELITPNTQHLKTIDDQKKKNSSSFTKQSTTNDKEGRKSSPQNITLNLFKERKSIIKIVDQDQQVKKNIVSIFSKAVKEKKTKKTTPQKQKEDRFFIINEEGGSKDIESSSLGLQEQNGLNGSSKKSLGKVSLVLIPGTNDKKIFDFNENESNRSFVDFQEIENSDTLIQNQKTEILSTPNKKSGLSQFHFQMSEDSSQDEKNSNENNSNKLELNSQFKNEFNNQKNQKSEEQINTLQLNKNESNDKIKNNSILPYKMSNLFNGQQNSLSDSFYNNKIPIKRSEEESRVLIGSLQYYKKQEKAINKVILKKQMETGEIQDSFHNSLLTIDLKSKQNRNEGNKQNKKLLGFIGNQLQELQNDGNEINLIKEVQYFEDERKHLKNVIKEQMKYQSPRQSTSIKENRDYSSTLRRSLYTNQSSRKTNISLNSISIDPIKQNNTIKQQQSQQQQQNISPSSLPSILKNIFTVNPPQNELAVKIVKFPTLQNKKGVAFKNGISSDNRINDRQYQNQSEQTNNILNNSAIIPFREQNSPFKQNLSPNNQFDNKKQKFFQNPKTINTEQQNLNQESRQSSRGRMRYFGGVLNTNQSSTERDKKYQQYSPERFKEDEQVLDEYKKAFLHLNQIYKTTIQASKERLIQNKFNQNEKNKFEQQFNQEDLRKFQGQEKGSKFLKIFQKKLGQNQEHNQQTNVSSEVIPENKHLNFFRTIDQVNEDRQKQSKLTKILQFVDQKSTNKQRKSIRKSYLTNNLKKISRNSIIIENKVLFKRKNNKKRNQQIEGSKKSHNLPSLKSRKINEQKQFQFKKQKDKEIKEEDEQEQDEHLTDDDEIDEEYKIQNIIDQQILSNQQEDE